MPTRLGTQNQKHHHGKRRISTTFLVNGPLRDWIEREAARDGVSIAFVIANALSYASGIPSGNEEHQLYVIRGKKHA